MVVHDHWPATVSELRWVRLPGVSAWRAPSATGSWLWLRYSQADQVADFVVEPRGREVWCCLSETVAWDEAVELLLGPVWSCVLAHRGVLCLHAAVLGLAGGAVALLGEKGAGKSTASLALLARGATLVSDDVAVLRRQLGGVQVVAGLPRLRVGPEAARHAGLDYTALAPLWGPGDDRPDKRYVVVPPAPTDCEDLPLRAIYWLRPREPEGHDVELMPTRGPRAVSLLMAHRHVAELLTRDQAAAALSGLAAVVAAVRVVEVRRPDSLAALGETLERIEADVRDHRDELASPAAAGA